MAKAKDLLGRSGAAGLGGSLTPMLKPVALTEDQKSHGPQHKGHGKHTGPGGGQSLGGGGGKTPVGQRPKV